MYVLPTNIHDNYTGNLTTGIKRIACQVLAEHGKQAFAWRLKYMTCLKDLCQEQNRRWHRHRPALHVSPHVQRDPLNAACMCCMVQKLEALVQAQFVNVYSPLSYSGISPTAVPSHDRIETALGMLIAQRYDKYHATNIQ